jgi:hypothetical protein
VLVRSVRHVCGCGNGVLGADDGKIRHNVLLLCV